METKSVLVTGASGGIGRAAARMLVEQGQDVTALDLEEAALKDVLGDLGNRIAFQAGDVSREDDCQAAVDAAIARYGKLDALLHFAATHSTLPWDELGPEEWARVLSVNVTGAFLMAQAAARHMAERGSGAIVLTASSVILSGGAGGAGRGGPAYASSKGAIIALNRSLARSLGPSGIRVNAVSPGNIETPMIAGYSEEAREASKKRAVLGRIGEPEELAAAAIFLISDEASFMTGENMNVNGGASFS